MMRGLVIATNGDMRVQTFTAPALEDVQKVVGGYVETVPVRNIEGHYLLSTRLPAFWPARRSSALWF